MIGGEESNALALVEADTQRLCVRLLDTGVLGRLMRESDGERGRWRKTGSKAPCARRGEIVDKDAIVGDVERVSGGTIDCGRGRRWG